jgi:flagellar biosynthesis protein FlhF
MKVKKYVVDTMPEAMQKIRNELGKDAVIINTKPMRVGGFFGLFSSKKLEVVAAADVHQPARPKQPPQNDVSHTDRTPTYSEQFFSTQLEEIKSLLLDVKRTQPTASALVMDPPKFAPIRQWLAVQGVRPTIVDELLQQATQCTTESEVFACVQSALTHRLSERPLALISPHTKLIHLVGPTGVGKTTTIAKLAAEQVLKHRKSIALITSDTYRIAAIEQLRTYASILDIPMETVYSPIECARAIEKFADRDYIFMDTAGRNYRNELAVSELQTLLQAPCPKHTYLVLSLTTKYADMRAVTDHFMKYGIDNVVLTKADETDTFGAVINLLNDYPLSLSYVTNGQNVPDDIARFDAAQFVHSWGGTDAL